MKIVNSKPLFLFLLTIAMIGTSCFNDLDTVPLDPDEVTEATVYDDPDSYKQVLAKLYAGLATSGQEGPAGQGDISGIDEGFGQYLRAFWNHQELPTDEAVIGWADQTIKDFHEQDWDANDVFIAAFYYRIFYQVSVCNEFLRQTTDEKLSSRNVDEALKADIQVFRAEARFLRALSYWHGLDHFRNIPFIPEDDPVGSFFPEQIAPEELYNFIESELLAIESILAAPAQNQYGRADQGAAWMLLAKLYLNAEVYIGRPAYTECIDMTKKLIDGTYTLEEEFGHLFLADNHLSNEIIFPVVFDGNSTRTWGGTTYIIRAGLGGSMNPDEFGVLNGWGGTRVTSALVDKYPAVAGEGGGGLIVSPATGEEHPVVYIPGNYQGWNPADDNATLASPNDDRVYEGYAWFEAGTEFRITDGPSFATSYGDNNNDGKLDLNGINLKIADAGFYRMLIDLNNLDYVLEPISWGIIGDATENGWDSDIDMVYNSEEGVLEVETFLNRGKIKFRANDAWDINLGDDDADALLEAEGADIDIASNGIYKIKLFLNKPDYTYSIETTSFDKRAMFYTDGQKLEIEDISLFTEGYASQKFKNITRDGEMGSNLDHPDTDFPMFRLADAYLMYAEAVVRGGSGGDLGTATQLVNQVRERAYGNAAGNITEADLDLPFLIDERARELFWECHRRTDLIRFQNFTETSYMWPWKGGQVDGVSTESYRNIYPIPAADIGANPNLDQNPEY